MGNAGASKQSGVKAVGKNGESTFCGIMSPICLAVFRLMISSNFFGWMSLLSSSLETD